MKAELRKKFLYFISSGRMNFFIRKQKQFLGSILQTEAFNAHERECTLPLVQSLMSFSNAVLNSVIYCSLFELSVNILNEMVN